jgi:hypothetical protein
MKMNLSYCVSLSVGVVHVVFINKIRVLNLQIIFMTIENFSIHNDRYGSNTEERRR